MKRNDLCIKILQMLFHGGEITRTQIISETGLRPASVFSAVDELKSEGLLIEPERSSGRTGRKSPPLSLSPDTHWFAGLDFQSHRTLGVITDLSGRIRHSAEKQNTDCSSAESCRQAISALLSSLRSAAGSDWERVCGLGFSDPGLVDIEKRCSLGAVNIPGWGVSDTGNWLEQTTGLPCGIWPESLLKTYMEYRSRPDCGSLFHIGIDEGVGGGFVKDGRLFSGDTNQAMEIGHIVIDPDGPQCQCGNRGCLEAVAGENGIRRKVRSMVRSGVDTSLDPDNFSLSKLAVCVQYDKAARIIANEVSISIGRALAIVTALLNPSVIIISGGLTGLGNLLLDNIRQTLALNCFPAAQKHLRIEFSTIDRWGAALGAALQMRDQEMLNSRPYSPEVRH